MSDRHMQTQDADLLARLDRIERMVAALLTELGIDIANQIGGPSDASNVPGPVQTSARRLTP